MNPQLSVVVYKTANPWMFDQSFHGIKFILTLDIIIGMPYLDKAALNWSVKVHYGSFVA